MRAIEQHIPVLVCDGGRHGGLSGFVDEWGVVRERREGKGGDGSFVVPWKVGWEHDESVGQKRTHVRAGWYMGELGAIVGLSVVWGMSVLVEWAFFTTSSIEGSSTLR